MEEGATSALTGRPSSGAVQYRGTAVCGIIPTAVEAKRGGDTARETKTTALQHAQGVDVDGDGVVVGGIQKRKRDGDLRYSKSPSLEKPRLLVDESLVFVVSPDPEPSDCPAFVFNPQRPVAVVHAHAPKIPMRTVQVQRRMPRIFFEPIVLLTRPLLDLTGQFPEVTPEPSGGLVG